MPVTCAVTLPVKSHAITTNAPREVSTFLICLKTLRFKEVKTLAQGLTAHQHQCWGSDPERLALDCTPLTTRLLKLQKAGKDEGGPCHSSVSRPVIAQARTWTRFQLPVPLTPWRAEAVVTSVRSWGPEVQGRCCRRAFSLRTESGTLSSF